MGFLHNERSTVAEIGVNIREFVWEQMVKLLFTWVSEKKGRCDNKRKGHSTGALNGVRGGRMTADGIDSGKGNICAAEIWLP